MTDYGINSTGVDPSGGQSPSLYRVSTDMCSYNAYTDTTGCSCVIYTDTFDDTYTICQTSSADTAYYWSSHGCDVSDLAGEDVALIVQNAYNAYAASMTGAEYCSGTYDSDPQILGSILSMPVGLDANITNPAEPQTCTSAEASAATSIGDNTQTPFSGPCLCQLQMCDDGGCDDAEPYDVAHCLSGSQQVLRNDGTYFECFYDRPTDEETLYCQCAPASCGSATSTSSITSSGSASSDTTSPTVSASITATITASRNSGPSKARPLSKTLQVARCLMVAALLYSLR